MGSGGVTRGRAIYSLEPVKVFDSISTTQTSSGLALGASFSRFGMQVVSLGSSFACQLQVSISSGESNYRTAATIDTSCGDVSGDMTFIADMPVHFVRANLISTTTAGTTVYISASQ